MALLRGLRYQVGGGWIPYERYRQIAGVAELGDILAMSDPGYQLLNWLVQQAGVRVWGVHLACGIILSWGLVCFARMQSEP
jgi:hypothetical protein